MRQPGSRSDSDQPGILNRSPIGVLDSGVGGLSVVRCLTQALPYENVTYFADQAHVPYGNRSLREVRAYAEGITDFLLRHGAKLIVVACNTASAAALHHLRRVFPRTLFVGMEPAVKPAAQATLNGIVGVLATPATFEGRLFASVVDRFAADVTVLKQPIPGLVDQIEAGDLDGPETRAILEGGLSPLLAQGVDTLVLACTHFPFVIQLIEELTPRDVRVIDPAPAVARQAGRLLGQNALSNPGGKAGKLRLYTSGEAARLEAMTKRLIGLQARCHTVRWQDRRVVIG